MTSRVAPHHDGEADRIAVVDLGSNTFRLVVFEYHPGRYWRLADEIREGVRISAGAGDGVIQPAALERAGRTAQAFARYCAAARIDRVEALATSAIREADNGAEALAAINGPDGLTARVISTEEEARYGYLGVVNTTTLTDGMFLDVGGGSMQIGRLEGRLLEDLVSRRLGAVRMTERFMPGSSDDRAGVKRLRRYVERELEGLPWLEAGTDRMVGIGGNVRTLAAMAQRAEDYPLREIHGYHLDREVLKELVKEMSQLPVDERSNMPGLKRDRADIMLAGATVILAAMDVVGIETLEVCGYGLREGALFEHLYAPADPPLVPDVRRASVLNLAAVYGVDGPHADHVADLALQLFDGLARIGLHDADGREREWLWAAAMLHDVGVLIDYHDHHKHSQYLVQHAGLPGFTHRELSIIAELTRGHRKGLWPFHGLPGVHEPGDEERYDRLRACLRLAEQLDRGRARTVTSAVPSRNGDAIRVLLESTDDPQLALWAAQRESPAFEQAFGLRLQLTDAVGTPAA
jgi:exopolyphosphatase / guanosine-5'-triphosphate,3'-diphosphate pyrophosphatase